MVSLSSSSSFFYAVAWDGGGSSAAPSSPCPDRSLSSSALLQSALNLAVSCCALSIIDERKTGVRSGNIHA